MSAFHNDISGFQPRTHAPANTCLKPDIYIYECDYYIYIYIYIYMTTEMKVQVVTSFTIKQYVSKYVFK
jgi:hypothetical protein